MKEKTKLRVIQILCIVSLLITLFSIQRTYAKYYETMGTTYSTDIKKWVIRVKNLNIHNQEQLNSVMTPVIEDDVNMNSNNTLVPGRKGYFPFEIDYEYVDLSFRFEFDFEQLNTNQLEDFEIYGYSIIKGDKTVTVESTDISTFKPEINIELDQDTNNYTYSITDTNISSEDLNALKTEFNESGANKKVEIRVLFRWKDENADTEDEASESGMNNYEDTTFAGEVNASDSIHDLLKYNVKITFTQKI